MDRGIVYTGIPSTEELASCPGRPSADRMARGRVAVIECVQEIPCNPCQDACRFHAIEIGDEITKLPTLHEDLCTGCARCVAMCPGQAIVIVNQSYMDTEASVDFPYEYLPIPSAGMEVDAVNRAGEVVCRGKIIRVTQIPDFAQTAVVSMAIPKEFIHQVRGMRRLQLKEEM